MYILKKVQIKPEENLGFHLEIMKKDIKFDTGYLKTKYKAEFYCEGDY